MSNSLKKSIRIPDLKVFHKGVVLVMTPLIIAVILISALSILLAELDKESMRETRFRQCAAVGAKVIALGNDAIMYVFASLQGNQKFFMQAYDKAMNGAEDRQVLLLKISAGDPNSVKAAKNLSAVMADFKSILDPVADPLKEGQRLLDVSEKIGNLQKIFDSKRETVQIELNQISSLQEKIAQESAARCERLQTFQFQILSLGLLSNVLAGVALLIYYRASIYSRLQLVLQNTMRLAQNKALAPPLSGIDEIAQLDRAFHKMDSDLKQAAQREQDLFNNASDVICVLDHELNFLKMNPACQKMWGYSPQELLGKNVMSLISQEHRDSARQLFEQALRSREMSNLELVVDSAGGQTSESLWSSYYSRSESSLYCVVYDITERKRIERAKHEFISMMSSDLRQPLRKISDNIANLIGPLKGELSAKALSRFENAHKNIGRLVILVNDLLQMTAMQSTSLESKREQTAVRELLARSVQDLEGMAQKTNVRFEIDCQAEQWFVDPNRIMQVIVNLGSNAIKFSPPQAIIRISARVENADLIRVEVIDQGRGVPSGHQKSIFEKFSQVEASDGKRKSGTGLGLPICKDIIEANGGAIGVISEEGQGSTFWFTSPRTELAFDKIVAAQAEAKLPQAMPTSPLSDLPVLAKPGKGKAFGTKFTLMQKGVVLIVVPLLFEAFFVFQIFTVMAESQRSQAEEQHEQRIASTSYKILQAYFNASQEAVRAGRIENWNTYNHTCSSIIENGDRLRRLVKGDRTLASQFASFEKLQRKMEAAIVRGRSIMIAGFTPERANAATLERFQMWALAMSISHRLGKLIDEVERKQFVNPEKQAELRRQQGVILLLGLSGNALLSLLLAAFFSKDITLRLAAQADNAGRLARDLPLNPVLPGSDEIAKLDSVFHETAEKLAEARRKERAVFDNSQDLICVLDAGARFIATNPAAERMLGDSSVELKHKSLLDFVSSDEDLKIEEELGKDLSAGKSLELKIVQTGGQELYLAFSLSRPLNQENIYCVAHDISARKELEQLKQEFLSVVSHDLRSPLTSVTGTATLIEEGATGPLGDNARVFVHDIIVQGEQLIELINDLLDLEKLEAGKMQLMKSNVAAPAIIDRCRDNMQKNFEGKLLDCTQALLTVDLDVDAIE